MRCRLAGMIGIVAVFLVTFGCTPIEKEVEATPSNPQPQAEAGAAPVGDVACGGSYELALEFQGITHLVSPQIVNPQDAWVLFPRVDESFSQAKLGVELPRHEPRLYLPQTGVVLTGVESLTGVHCPPDRTPCQAVSLEGKDLRLEGVVEGPLSAAWTNDDPDRSLFLLLNFRKLADKTAELRGVETLPQEQTFAALQRVPFIGDGLAARFRATTGHLQTRKHSKGSFRFGLVKDGVPDASFGPAVPKLAKSFEVVSDIEGCATLRLTDLRTGAEAGTIRIDGNQTVRVIAEHAPAHEGGSQPTTGMPCDNFDHLKAHYLLQRLPEQIDGNGLVVVRDAPGGGMGMNCDANCSPGCSEPKP